MQSRLGAPSEHQTSDASIGYPLGLTGERFISFARNTINRGLRKNTIYGRRKNTIHGPLNILIHNKYKSRNTAISANTIHGPAKTLLKNPQVYTQITYNFLTSFRLIRFAFLDFFSISHPYPSLYRHFKLQRNYKIAIRRWDVGKEV